MSFALAAAAFAPALAIGSFLNVVAARVPLKRSIVSPGSACMSCGHELAWYENIPVRLVSRPARPLPWLRRLDRPRLSGGRAAHRPPRRSLLPRVRLVGEVVRRRVLLRDARGDLRDRPLAPDRPQCDRAAGGGDRSRRDDRARAERGMGARRPSARRSSSFSPRSPIRRAWAWATSSSRSCSAPCSAARCPWR